MYQNYKH